jgi:hypothetical protein
VSRGNVISWPWILESPTVVCVKRRVGRI